MISRVLSSKGAMAESSRLASALVLAVLVSRAATATAALDHDSPPFQRFVPGNGDFDLKGMLLKFQHNGDNNPAGTYSFCAAPYDRLPVSKKGSTQLDVDEDNSHAVLKLRKLNKFDFKFFDATFKRLKVSSNGYLTFGPLTKPNRKSTSVEAHFRDPKIAGLTMDFDLSDSKSKIFYKYDEDMDAVAVLYHKVKHAENNARYTFQIVLHREGDIWIYYKKANLKNNAVVGISKGIMPDAPQESDLTSVTCTEPTPAPTAAPTAAPAPTTYAPTPAPTVAPTPAPTMPRIPGTDDGLCGPDNGNVFCPDSLSPCCSGPGGSAEPYTCGNSQAHCAESCIPEYSFDKAGSCQRGHRTGSEDEDQCGPIFGFCPNDSKPCCSGPGGDIAPFQCGSSSDHCDEKCIPGYSYDEDDSCSEESRNPSLDGQCGLGAGGTFCYEANMPCCSFFGYCGNSVEHCVSFCDSTHSLDTSTTCGNVGPPRVPTEDNTCGADTGFYCTSSDAPCCSKFGYCGESTDHCEYDSCQEGYSLDPSRGGSCQTFTESQEYSKPESEDGRCGWDFGDTFCGNSNKPCCSGESPPDGIETFTCGSGADYCDTESCVPEASFNSALSCTTNLTSSPDGRCGTAAGGAICITDEAPCCSYFGWCGNDQAHCDPRWFCVAEYSKDPENSCRDFGITPNFINEAKDAMGKMVTRAASSGTADLGPIVTSAMGRTLSRQAFKTMAIESGKDDLSKADSAQSLAKLVSQADSSNTDLLDLILQLGASNGADTQKLADSLVDLLVSVAEGGEPPSALLSSLGVSGNGNVGFAAVIEAAARHPQALPGLRNLVAAVVEGTTE